MQSNITVHLSISMQSLLYYWFIANNNIGDSIQKIILLNVMIIPLFKCNLYTLQTKTLFSPSGSIISPFSFNLKLPGQKKSIIAYTDVVGFTYFYLKLPHKVPSSEWY